MKARHTGQILSTIILLALWLPAGRATATAPPPQVDDPVAQCAEGVQLFLAGKAAEALPLLEASFAGWEGTTFADPDDLGRCALALGLLRDNTGDRPGALEALGVALEVFQASGNRLFEGTTLDHIGAVYRAQGRYEETLEAFQQALIILREVGDGAGEGATLSNIGAVYDDQGRYAEALDYYQQALAVWREVGDRIGEGRTLTGIGLVYDHQGRYAEVLDYYQQALAILREVGDRAGEGTTLSNIGGVYRVQGRYVEALEVYQQSLAIRREVGDRTGEGITLNNIGLVYYAQGRYAEALEALQQALAIRREVGDKAGEGTTLNNIGLVYYAQGRYAEALDTYQQTLAILREVGDRAGEGATLTGIGAVYRAQGRYAEALEAFQKALAILREVGDRAGEGTTLNNIGLVYDDQGRYAEALEALQQALAIRREVGDRAGEGTTLHNIGGVYHDQGRYAEALEVYQQALAIACEVGDRIGEGTTLHNIGAVYQHQDEPDQALAYYEQAMDVFESVRAVAGSEAGRASFIAQYASLYDRAVNLYHTQGQDAQAFFTAERGRARAFLDAISTGYVQLSDAASADLLAREQAAHAARQTSQDALSRARAQQPPDAALIADLESQLAAAEEEHAAAITEIEARHDQLAALVPGRGAVLDLPQVQALLDGQTTLLSFWVLQDQTLAFVVTRDSLRTVALPVSQADLSAQITDFRSFPNLDAAHPESAVTLYTGLIAPLKQHLTTPHLMIVPHSVLHYVPFAALTDGQRGLLDDYTLTYLPNASVLSFIRQSADRAGGTPLILGNPTTADFDTTASLATERDQLGPLPFAEQEARAIADLYATNPLIHTAATESVVRQQANETGILHLAAHGYYNPIAPLNSLIALAPDDANDGWLTAGEVYGLDLQQADLVVLSACQTHLGDLSAGDELVGLTRAFFYAGTPTVVASLWTVDDQATALLMERFYTHLQAGMGKAAALRQAQLDLRADYPNPYYWAAFVLSGDAGEVSPVSETPPSSGEDEDGDGICPSLALPLALVSVIGALIARQKR